jgi:hypothetical protein
LFSPAVSVVALPKLLEAGGFTPRGLPEGEYLHGSASPRKSDPRHSDEMSPWRRTDDGMASAPEVHHLPTIPSAAVLTEPGPGEELLGADWAQAVARGEPWTKAEPWASLWKRSEDLKKEEEEAERRRSRKH